MAVLQMKKIHICALKSNRKQILEYLQRKGNVQICAEEGPELFQRTDTSAGCAKYEKRAQSAKQALKILDNYAPEKKGLLASFAGKRQISLDDFTNMERNRGAAISKAEAIVNANRVVAEQKANLVKLQVQHDTVTPWLPLDVPMNYRGSKSTRAFIGSFPQPLTLEEILAMLAQSTPELDASVEIISADADQTCIFAVCPKAQAELMDEALRQNGFSRPSLQTPQVPEDYVRGLKAQTAESEKRIADAENKLRSYGGARRELELMHDYYLMRAEKYEVLGGLLQSEHAFFLDGFVPANQSSALQKTLEERYECFVELEDVPEDEEAPVLLKNNAFAAPTEGVITSFGLPHKGEMDPTSIMAVCYYFLFGLMLSDAAYGLIMTLGCFLLLRKFRNMELSMKSMLTMFMYCGISTMFWGVMFGSYFGDAITVIAKTFFGKTVVIPAVWMVPMDDPMRMLIFCFLFGIIHLFLGLGLKGYSLLKEGKVMDFACDVLTWFVLLLGLLFMLLPSDLFRSISQMDFGFPPIVSMIAKIAAIVGAVGIIVFAKRDTENFGVRIALGLYELYGATSWLSDVLSYSRLLALGLATGVIASVINQMGAMLGGGVVGAIVFIIVFLLGHTLNLAINVLGAYVHTNRLQFVEFFGKFYEGGGSAFKPFNASTKYINISEEK